MDERQDSTEDHDIYSTRIRLTRDGLTYGEEFVPITEISGIQPESYFFWNPGTKLFEIAIHRRGAPDLIVKNLSLHTAEQLREALIDALRERYA